MMSRKMSRVLAMPDSRQLTQKITQNLDFDEKCGMKNKNVLKNKVTGATFPKCSKKPGAPL